MVATQPGPDGAERACEKRVYEEDVNIVASHGQGLLRQVTIEIDQVEGSSDEGPRDHKVEALRAQMARQEED